MGTGNAHGAELRDASDARGRAGPATSTATALDSLLNLDGPGAGGRDRGTGATQLATSEQQGADSPAHATPQPTRAPSSPGSEGKLSRLPAGAYTRPPVSST
jgi:hypothetical protein